MLFLRFRVWGSDRSRQTPTAWCLERSYRLMRHIGREVAQLILLQRLEEYEPSEPGKGSQGNPIRPRAYKGLLGATGPYQGLLGRLGSPSLVSNGLSDGGSEGI